MKVSLDIKDQELARQLKEGSKDAFRILYGRYGIKIHRFAYSYLKSEHDAEELVQDVFLKLWDKRLLLDGSGNIRSYIFKVAVNSIYDFIRRKNVEQAFHEFASGKDILTEGTWDEVVYNDMLAQIHRLMDKMPEQRRRIFKLSRENGLSNDEIAASLGLSKRTVENQLYRATAFLKENLPQNSAFAMLFFYLFC
ncbi:RNA polymerase sigma-70 factor [uncultured Sunxiuqinia sp.]|uniref:RNA polymerase sigma-70 factor n=1 Tax=uncultured Sunxiuqinia sp. TaxID=1573825 RepID=UPI002AA8E7C7|nr:RNA polymerase sigma-70 factor [uncultured Sunxiuqinia sp.]